MQGLTGKRVIVTGGTSGIGERSAELFVAEGAKVAGGLDEHGQTR